MALFILFRVNSGNGCPRDLQDRLVRAADQKTRIANLCNLAYDTTGRNDFIAGF
jgi:hypothetical protein